MRKREDAQREMGDEQHKRRLYNRGKQRCTEDKQGCNSHTQEGI